MRRLPALLALLSVALVTACGSPTASPSPSRVPSGFPAEASPPPTASPEPQAVVSIETRGGECGSGSCNRLVNIDGDGTLHQVIPNDEVLGTVPEPALDALRIEVEQANYPLLQSKPFTGECPTAFDGQETIYTFHATSGDEEIASCKVAIDPNHPLFQALAAAVAAAGGL